MYCNCRICSYTKKTLFLSAISIKLWVDTNNHYYYVCTYANTNTNSAILDLSGKSAMFCKVIKHLRTSCLKLGFLLLTVTEI